MSTKRPICFPASHIFERQYKDLIPDHLLASKTWPTISQKLSNTCVQNYSVSAFLALYNYDEHMCNIDTEHCVMAKLNSNKNHKIILNALSEAGREK